MRVTAGVRLKSAVDDTQVIVVRAPDSEVTITCGGHELIPLDADPGPGGGIEPGHDGGTQLGKRYTDPDAVVELLCTKAGKGSLCFAGQPMDVKAAKNLPASD